VQCGSEEHKQRRPIVDGEKPGGKRRYVAGFHSLRLLFNKGLDPGRVWEMEVVLRIQIPADGEGPARAILWTRHQPGGWGCLQGWLLVGIGIGMLYYHRERVRSVSSYPRNCGGDMLTTAGYVDYLGLDGKDWTRVVGLDSESPVTRKDHVECGFHRMRFPQ